MTSKVEVYAYSNEKLLEQFMNSRDNFLHFKIASFQCPNDDTIKEMLELEEQNFQILKAEIYRRMKK